MKKIALLMSFLTIIMALTACGHEHRWEEATCTEPKTCRDCGKTEGESNGHNWIEATCTEPEHCAECGEVKEGTEKGHNYQDGYCTRCKEKDPSFTPLSDYGFVNNNGMKIWIPISGYSYQKNEVTINEYIKGNTFGDVYVFESYCFYKGSYIKYDNGDIIDDWVISNGKFHLSNLRSKETYTCNSIGNDYIDFVDDNYRQSLRITDRIVVGKSVILKTERSHYGYGDEGIWFVPADMLDLSTASLHKSEDKREDWGDADVIHINFKD